MILISASNQEHITVHLDTIEAQSWITKNMKKVATSCLLKTLEGKFKKSSNRAIGTFLKIKWLETEGALLLLLMTSSWSVIHRAELILFKEVENSSWLTDQPLLYLKQIQHIILWKTSPSLRKAQKFKLALTLKFTEIQGKVKLKATKLCHS